ncbi:helix-turn-helix domain-containing protein [Oenococcus alcoholitolerans]|uniref:helix-turn-helix domain-containing protein n=1 Tax=Oenococcus alcoholitolerans TaxID=931074 RepID=UPI003F70ED63
MFNRDENFKNDFFVKQLHEAFNETHMSVEDLASSIGVGENTVKNWLKGKTMPRLQMIRKLASAFDKKASWFLDI